MIQSRIDGSGDGVTVVVVEDNSAADFVATGNAVADNAAVDCVVVDDSVADFVVAEVATDVVVDNLASAAMGEAASVLWSSKISKRSVPGLD